MRYAIYLTPTQGSALEARASLWLGRSAFDGHGQNPEAPSVADPATPARYGFHATMRAPFRLEEGRSEAELLEAFEAFSRRHANITTSLTVAALGPFFALTAPDEKELAALHGDSLAAFENLRAPLTPTERARRKTETLDARGLQLLDEWGYPHVLERFTFHMTLSGRVAAEHRAAVERAATQYFEEVCAVPQTLRFAVFVEREPGGPFTVLAI